MKFDVYDLDNNVVGSEELDDGIFSTEVKPWLLHETVVSQLAGRRSGTKRTRARQEVRGGGRKPFKQKGTGRARQGTIRAPHMVGGADALALRPRDFSYRPNKKACKAALRVALSVRAKQNKVKLVRDMNLQEPKTGKLRRALDKLAVPNALVVESRDNRNLYLSARNLGEVKVLPVEGVNVYDLLKYPNLVLTVAAARQLQERAKA